MPSIQELENEIKMQNVVIKGYEKVLKLNEKELANAEQMIKIYESIVAYSTEELKAVKETMSASDIVANMSREELISALGKIKVLEQDNKKLREESQKLNNL